jgi:hypothetical protein
MDALDSREFEYELIPKASWEAEAKFRFFARLFCHVDRLYQQQLAQYNRVIDSQKLLYIFGETNPLIRFRYR